MYTQRTVICYYVHMNTENEMTNNTAVVYKHSAGGLVFKDNHVLLINWEPPRSTFDFPKGTIEPGESPEATCVREVLEETGYATRIISYIGQTHYEYDWTDGTHHDKRVDYYLLALTDSEGATPAREAHEKFENVWCSIDEAVALITKDIDKDILRKALEIRDTIKHST